MIKPNSRVKTLLVEDEKIPQMMAGHMLRECDCEVDIVSTGKDALVKAVNNNYQIIFMDIGLDDISGYEVTKIIRKNGGDMKIVALTAHSDEDTRKQCMLSGMNDFLTKPLTIEKIKGILKKIKE